MPELAAIADVISTWALPLIFAITLHEAAHGYIALKLGDETALRQGRVSFNPLVHVDPFGTLIMPGMLLLVGAPFLFGYAKPVPVNAARLNNPRRDMIWVALAGPGINVLLAVVSALAMHVALLMPDTVGQWLLVNLRNSIIINLILAIFNMLPIPPLDGGRVAAGVLPEALARPFANIERYGMLVLIGLLFLLPMIGDAIGVDLHIFRWLIEPPVRFLDTAILTIFGPL